MKTGRGQTEPNAADGQQTRHAKPNQWGRRVPMIVGEGSHAGQGSVGGGGGLGSHGCDGLWAGPAEERQLGECGEGGGGRGRVAPQVATVPSAPPRCTPCGRAYRRPPPTVPLTPRRGVRCRERRVGIDPSGRGGRPAHVWAVCRISLPPRCGLPVTRRFCQAAACRAVSGDTGLTKQRSQGAVQDACGRPKRSRKAVDYAGEWVVRAPPATPRPHPPTHALTTANGGCRRGRPVANSFVVGVQGVGLRR